MIKVLIGAVFLSQALIFIQVLTAGDQHGSPNNSRKINTTRIRPTVDRTLVVPNNDWDTPKAPVPYWFFWTCTFEGQTAQQCVAIHSMLSEELKE